MYARRNFNPVFHRFRTGGSQEGLLGKVTGYDRMQPFGHFDVLVVRGDLHAHMSKAAQLLANRFRHLRMQMADVEHTDAAGEIDVLLARFVPNNGALRFGHKKAIGGGNTSRNELGAFRRQLRDICIFQTQTTP